MVDYIESRREHQNGLKPALQCNAMDEGLIVTKRSAGLSRADVDDGGGELNVSAVGCAEQLPCAVEAAALLERPRGEDGLPAGVAPAHPGALEPLGDQGLSGASTIPEPIGM
jgi:hypothetical protein